MLVNTMYNKIKVKVGSSTVQSNPSLVPLNRVFILIFANSKTMDFLDHKLERGKVILLFVIISIAY